MCIVKMNTSVYTKRKARVIVVYNSHIFFNFMNRKKKSKERKGNIYFFRIHTDIKNEQANKTS